MKHGAVSSDGEFLLIYGGQGRTITRGERTICAIGTGQHVRARLATGGCTRDINSTYTSRTFIATGTTAEATASIICVTQANSMTNFVGDYRDGVGTL